MDDFAGRQLGPYRIETLLGRGGMGDVYLAHHERLDRPCALKLLRPQLSSDPELRERFVREARSAARLDHPRIVTVYDAGEEDGVAYIAMQLVEGEPLSRLIQAGTMSRATALGILRDVADALDTAHGAGMVHRDVKPANILITADGRAMLADFGVVHLQPEAQLTMTGQLLGTPAYMSPEQITGGDITPRTDIYQLAVVAYELLSGELPFRASEPASLLVAHLQEAPVPIDQRVPGLPAEATVVLNRGLHKLADERQASASEFVTALGSALDASSVGTASEGSTRRSVRVGADDTTVPSGQGGLLARLLSQRAGLAAAFVLVGILGVVGLRALLADGDGGGQVPAPTATAAVTEVAAVIATATTSTATGEPDDVAIVGANTADAPERGAIRESFDMAETWPPTVVGATEFEEDGISRIRLEDPDVSVTKQSLSEVFSDGSVYLEVELASESEAYAEICLLARTNAEVTRGYAFCLDSGAETFAFFFDDSGEQEVRIWLLEQERRLGTLQPSDYNALEIRVRGDQLWFFINDELLGAATHAGPSRGEVAVSVFREGDEPYVISWGPLAILEIE